MKNANRNNGIRPLSAQTFFNNKTTNNNLKAPSTQKIVRPASAAIFQTKQETQNNNENKNAKNTDITRQNIKIMSYDFDFLKNCKDFSMNTTQITQKIGEKPYNDYHEYLFYKPKLNKNKEVCNKTKKIDFEKKSRKNSMRRASIKKI